MNLAYPLQEFGIRIAKSRSPHCELEDFSSVSCRLGTLRPGNRHEAARNNPSDSGRVVQGETFLREARDGGAAQLKLRNCIGARAHRSEDVARKGKTKHLRTSRFLKGVGRDRYSLEFSLQLPPRPIRNWKPVVLIDRHRENPASPSHGATLASDFRKQTHDLSSTSAVFSPPSKFRLAENNEQPLPEAAGQDENLHASAEQIGRKTDIEVPAVNTGSSTPFRRPSFFPGNATEDGYERLPINLDLELYRARCLQRKEAIDEAETILKQCIKDWPSEGRAYVSLGRLYLRKGNLMEARAVYEDGCQALRGENAFIWQAWAILEEKAGNIAKARKLFDAATVADLRHCAAWHGWAVLELRAGNTKKARDLLGKGIKYTGGNEYLFQTLALIEFKVGKLDEARTLFSQATDCNPKSCASWLAWALLEAEQERCDIARHLFQRSVQSSPRNRYAWQAWALFEAKQGNREQARKLFEKGHELNPRDAVLLQAFGLFEYECAHPVIARDHFRQAAAIDPKHQPIWIAWGWMEWKEGNLDAARELYRKSLSVNTQSMDAARTFQAWGVLEERDGNFGEAREFFKCTLKVDSQNTAAWLSWAKLEENLGNTVRAEEIRNLYLQQRTEVVEDVPWDMSLSNMLAPAIDRIKSFLKMEAQTKDQATFKASLNSTSGVMEGRLDPNITEIDKFDLDSFIIEKFPWKYSLESRKSGEKSNNSFLFSENKSSYKRGHRQRISRT